MSFLRNARARFLPLVLAGLLSQLLVTPAAGAPRPLLPGDEGWIARYDGATHGYDRPAGIASSTTAVFVTGNSPGGATLTDYATVAYNPSTGVQLWAARYNDAINGDDRVAGIAATADGSKVFVTGVIPSLATRSDYATVAYDGATGAQLWVSIYTRYDYQDGATAVAVSPDGSKVFVTGWSRSAASGVDYATIAYDSTTGAQLWVARYDGTGHGGDFARAIAVSPDGTQVAVTGESWGGNPTIAGTGNDFATVVYNSATGTRQWAMRQSGPLRSEDFATAVAFSPTGNRVFTTGRGFATTNDYVTAGYNASDGAFLWSARYGGSRGGYDGATAVGVSNDGGTVIVTGDSYGGILQKQNIATVAYATGTGARQWVRKYDGPTTGYADNDYAWSLAVNPVLNRVYITGSTDSFDQDYATFAYNIGDGATVWSARFDGAESAEDFGRAVAVAPDGQHVFVTGTSWGGYATADDYATSSYDA